MNRRFLLVFFVLLQTRNSILSFPTLIKDVLLASDKLMMISEISCNLRESVNLLKIISKKLTPIRILDLQKNLSLYDNLHNSQIFIMDLDCENSSKILETANELNLFTHSYKWILLHTKSLDIIKEYFDDINIMVHSEVSLVQKHENGSATLRKIFKYRANHEIQVEEAGFWVEDKGFDDKEREKNIARRRSDLHGITLKACIVITDNNSLNHLTDKRDKHIDSIAKVNYVLVEHLGSLLNAKLNYSVEPTWGYKNNKSEWSGMIGHLVKKQADIGGTPLFVTADRVDIIDYVSMTTASRSYFVFREPKLSYVTNVFTLPFDREVWLSTVALVILLGLCLYYIMMWEFKKRKYLPKKDRSEEVNHKLSVLDVAMLSFGAVCQQATDAVPTSVPGRIVTIFLFISLMFLYTSYAANIVALLQSSSSNIQTLQDLLNSRITLGVFDTVYNRYYFPNSREPVRMALYRQKIAPPGQTPHFMSLVDGVKKIRQGLFAFHMEVGVGYKVVGELFQESEKCGLKQIPFLEVVDPWLAIQKNSSYKELIKIGLRKIQETGLQNREVSAIYTKKPECLARGSNFISVGLVDCYPATVVLVVGIIASLLIWFTEILISKRTIVAERVKEFKNIKHYT